MTTTILKWITIYEEDYSGKTRKFTVELNSNEMLTLGTIQWESKVFAYAFHPNGNYLSANELREIADFIHKLMLDRKYQNAN